MDKKVVRASYERCLNATARLSAYATSKPILITEVNWRQDILAVDDLSDFCIHARRLIENIGLKNLLYQQSMESSDGQSPLSLGKIIGRLIHHNTLEIIRCGTRFRMLQARVSGVEGDEFFKKVEPEMRKPPFSEPITPHILFQSDRSDGMRLINLVIFLQIFSEKILLEVHTSNHWLGDDLFKDLDMTEEDVRKLLPRIR
jgi:hypothetical protein